MNGSREQFAGELRLQSDIDRDPETFTFRTRDGLLSKDEIRTAEQTLVEHVDPEHDDDVLVFDANYGVVGVVLARTAPDGATVMTETSARAADSCRDNAARNGVASTRVELTPDFGKGRGDFDFVTHAPKPYEPTDVVTEKIAKGLSRLQPGGTYYLAGSKQTGVKRYADALSMLTDSSERVTISDSCHLYRAECPGDYEPRSFVEEQEFRATVGDYTCRFITRPGLFSASEIDDGTAALLRHATADVGDRVLDLGCGYGAVGAFIGARTECSLWATDDDAVATHYARRNYERNGVSPEDVRTADCLDGMQGLTFDTVLSNPPTHAGKGVTQKLFTGVHEVLTEDGAFWLVANQLMDYADHLSEAFDFETEVVTEVENFDVIRARLG